MYHFSFVIDSVISGLMTNEKFQLENGFSLPKNIPHFIHKARVLKINVFDFR